MEKSGGDSSYLNSFVDNVLGNQQQTGGKTNKKAKTEAKKAAKKGGFVDLGVVELSPFLVSLMNIGAFAAVDPKLNKLGNKEKKTFRRGRKQGGADMQPFEMVAQDANVQPFEMTDIHNGMNSTGGANKGRKSKRSQSPKGRKSKRSQSPKRSKSPVKRMRRGRKQGGADMQPFEMVAQDANVQNAINAIGDMAGGRQSKNSGGVANNFMETFSRMPNLKDIVVQDVSSSTGGGAKKRKTQKGGDGEKCTDSLIGGTSKRGKKSKYQGGETQDLQDMHATDAFLEPFSLFGGKAQKRKGKKGGENVVIPVANPEEEWKNYMQPQAVVPMQPQAVVPMQPQAVVPMQPQAVAPVQPQAVVPMQPQAVVPVQPVPLGGGKLRKSRSKKGGAFEQAPIIDFPSPKPLHGGRRKAKTGGNEAQDLMHIPQ
jgi:hypothetical protein